ncbi:MAG: ferredoxin [Firmicutes bacterium]|jgi:ferredoxin|nr:ferredoxin [Bacillota bacterium]
MIKICIDKEKCISCGLCSSICELICENSKGMPKVNLKNIIESKSVKQLENAVSTCPRTCISYENLPLVQSKGSEGLIQLIEEMKEILSSYNGRMPSYKNYSFDRKEISANMPYQAIGSDLIIENYKSYGKAENVGKSIFNDGYYERKDEVALDLINNYMINKIYPFLIIDNGNDYLKESMEKLITTAYIILNEARRITGQNIEFSQDTLQAFEFQEDEKTISENKSFFYDGVLKAHSLVKKEIPLSQNYSKWITVESYEDYDFKKNKSTTVYGCDFQSIDEAARELKKDIEDLVGEKTLDIAEQKLKVLLEKKFDKAKEVLHKAFVEILNQINDYSSATKNCVFNIIPIDREKMHLKSEGLVDSIYKEYALYERSSKKEKQVLIDEVKKNIKMNKGDCVKYGTFKNKSIVWTVIDESKDTLLLLSHDCIMEGDFNWGSSNLREWLNRDKGFLEEFSIVEKRAIRKKKVKYLKNTLYVKYDEDLDKGSENYSGASDSHFDKVEEKVFLLSIEEVKKYLKDNGFDYIGYKKVGNERKKCAYWLRTIASGHNQTRIVDISGKICKASTNIDSYDYRIKGIRPALRINKCDAINGQGTLELPYELF